MRKYPLRKYPFDWKLIGDIRDGRPNLGGTVEVEMYRLLQYTLRDVLEELHIGSCLGSIGGWYPRYGRRYRNHFLVFHTKPDKPADGRKSGRVQQQV